MLMTALWKGLGVPLSHLGSTLIRMLMRAAGRGPQLSERLQQPGPHV